MIQFKQGMGKYHGNIINCPQCNRLKRQYSNCSCGYTIANDPNMVKVSEGLYLTQDDWERLKKNMRRVSYLGS